MSVVLTGLGQTLGALLGQKSKWLTGLSFNRDQQSTSTTALADHHCKADSRSIWPVFIVGSFRCGSTLLKTLLAAHDRLACPPESKFIAALEPMLDYPQVRQALKSLGLSYSDALKKLREFVNGIMFEYAASRGKVRWVDKTPNYYRILPFIDKLFEQRVLYLVLCRHPLDCVASLESYFYENEYHEDPDIARMVRQHGKGRYAWTKYWLEVYERAHVFAAEHPERVHMLKYEALVSHPEECLGGVLEFMGESYSPSLLKTAFSRLRREGYGDDKILATNGVHGGSVGRWKAWPAAEAEALWQLLGSLPQELGYHLDSSPGKQEPSALTEPESLADRS